MRKGWILPGLLFAAFPRFPHAAEIAATDIPAKHWASHSVNATVRNAVLPVNGGKFNGQTLVSHRGAAIALAKLGRLLKAHAWRGNSSVPVPDKIITGISNGPWERQTVSKYAFAVMLARMGDFIANGISRPPPGADDLARSVALPHIPVLKIPASDPAYSALVYLARERMVGPDSPLLRPDQHNITAAEMGKALAQFAFGVNDQMTPLGHNPDGSTKDINDRVPKP